MTTNNQIKYFLLFALAALLFGVFFGCLASFQFIWENIFNKLPFIKSRPLHVSSVVGWIFLASTGSIYFFMKQEFPEKSFSEKMMKVNLASFVISGLVIITSLLLGKFGGREYWEFHPSLIFFVLITWCVFLINFFLKIKNIKNQWPVYVWMWSTGIVFFLITFLESNLWSFAYFRTNVIRDITVQWKSYGALVGSWNMLVYGIATYLTEKLSENPKSSRNKMAFFLFFLGFFNLLFGWAHHIYVVPCSPWIRIISYGVSMTELIVLYKLIAGISKNNHNQNSQEFSISRLLLRSADYWILLNVFLAIIISIPSINIFTHGTHITVAHAMGSTIGINTFILLASVFYILIKLKIIRENINIKSAIIGLNISLVLFWITLLIAGSVKGYHLNYLLENHYAVMPKIKPFLIAFAFSGVGIFTSLLFIVVPSIKQILASK